MTSALPPSRVIRKPLTAPFLVALAALWLMCLPLYAVSLPLVGIRHPAAALSLLTLAFTLGFAGLEVIRQHTWRASRLTGTLALATGLAIIPYFYPQAQAQNSGYALAALVLSLGFFSSLQQFIFNHTQRQKLLAVLLLASWLAVLSVLGNQPPPGMAPFMFDQWVPHLPPAVTHTLLLTGLTLAAYILAREPSGRYRHPVSQSLLALTPLAFIPVLAMQGQPLLLLFALCAIALQQVYLARFASRRQHLAWLLAISAGAILAVFGLNDQDSWQWLTAGDQRALMLAWQQWQMTPFFGVGMGNGKPALLLLSASQAGHQGPVTLPSALLLWLIEGGLLIALGYLLVLAALAVRILRAPSGTRRVLVALVLPPLTGLMIYPASGTQWFNGVLLLLWLYWLDNLTSKYRRYPVLSHRYSQRIASRTVISALVLATLLCLSSVYLANRYLRESLLTSQRFALYQQHPWWQKKLYHAQQDRRFQTDLATLSDAARHQHLNALLRQTAQHPHFSGYQHAYQVALQIGDHQRARDIQQEARYLFPQAAKVWTTRHTLPAASQP
ncbi:Wzy polymerase domain-containing protein [Salinivibrio sp. ES.052]|uniref:Wzy polymerase domain-containing protein n=1 Tax=Salinivibrio sp. ES.052 TaxID=1882823 RepID=UPI00092ADDD1|nr:Wzy polymerase domain-containing protein [Salinivibrio sp. ES.052]SIO16328.1 Virulence factor membrane-bound polymerase, C-terminal [Salinivibrio sp. ES.052]SIO41647.1 Virulence factor membrane-bound polymerase, C-terminal [Salinivibrio sp. ES.052]